MLKFPKCFVTLLGSRQLTVCTSVNRLDDLLTLGSELSTTEAARSGKHAHQHMSKHTNVHAASRSSGSHLTEIFEHH